MEQIKLEATNEQTPPERLRELANINPTLASLVANNQPRISRTFNGISRQGGRFD